MGVSKSEGEVRNTSLAFSPFWQKIQEFLAFCKSPFYLKFGDFLTGTLKHSRNVLENGFYVESILQKIAEVFVCPFNGNVAEFSAYWGHLSWNCPSLQILSGGCGVVERSGSPENARRKSPRFNSRRGASGLILVMRRRMRMRRIIGR